MSENTAAVLISASVDSGVPRPIRNILFERFNMTHLVLSGFTPVSATSYPISPEFSNLQDLTTPDSNFSLSDNNKIVARMYITNPSRVKVLLAIAKGQFISATESRELSCPFEPVSVSYGNAGGARSVEQLRQVVIELQMVPIRSAIHIPVDVYIAVMNEKVPVNPDLFNKPLRDRLDRVEVFLNELISMAKALKAAREQNK